MKQKIRVILLIVILALLYLQGTPLPLVALMAVFFAILLLLREKLWNAASGAVAERLPFTASWPGWAKWLAIAIAFVIAYTLFKAIAFGALSLAGFNVQAEMLKALNASG